MMAINKIVLLIIFLIILLVLMIILFGTVNPLGEEFDLENQVRQCCIAFRASDCENLAIICNEESMESIGSLAYKLDMSDNNYELLKKFCNCCKIWDEEHTKCIEWW